MLLIDLSHNQAHGLDAALLPNPWGAFFSILLLLGVWRLGHIVLSKIFSDSDPLWSILQYQKVLVGVLVLSCLVFPLALIGNFGQVTAAIFAVLLLALGFSSVPSSIRLVTTWIGKWESNHISRSITIACIAMLAGYLLLALGPITEADALDYHVGVALRTLNTGFFPADPTWFHSRLAGAGEVLIALGLSIGAEQFGALLQWAGLSSIINLLLTCGDRNNNLLDSKSVEYRGWLILLLLSTPLFLAWISSPKPLILPGAMTTLALYLSYALFSRLQSPSLQNVHCYYALIFGLLLVASTMKFSFMLSAGLVILIVFYYQYKNNQLLTTLLVLTGTISLVFMPFITWKWKYFSGSLMELLTTPLPGGWPGTEQFETYLRSYRDSELPFPISLVVPSNIGNITTILGVGVLISIAGIILYKIWRNHLVLMAMLACILIVVLGQANARFFLEPFYWVLIALIISKPLVVTTNRTLFLPKALICLQSTGVGIAILYGIATISVGSLSDSLRSKVMHSVASDYSAMRWADEVLPRNATVITDLRSTALVPRQAHPTDWRSFLDLKDPNPFSYIQRSAADREFVYLLTNNTKTTTVPTVCLGAPYAGPITVAVATRNPWNKTSHSEVLIYEIRQSCLVKNLLKQAR